MNRRTTLTITIALGLALAGGVGTARASGGDSSGEEIGTIQSLDPVAHLVVLTDGTEFLVTDPAVLSNLHEGDLVKVDFTQEGGRYFVDRIEPADGGNAPAASPAMRGPRPDVPMRLGEDQPISAQPSADDHGEGRLEGPEAP